MLHNLKYNLVLHERVYLVTMETAMTPYVAESGRLSTEELGGGITRLIVRHGFAETPDVPKSIASVVEQDVCHNAITTGYFISRQTLVPSHNPGMVLWRDHLFAAMVRNAETPMTFFKLPVNRVIELGTQLEI